ncbi:MAG: hypothetical protein IPJ88_14605 [Myxococcales bacterium]|nr:MAG: hypothetical protein IPJ88_14605 [Myxococcales bacterium]
MMRINKTWIACAALALSACAPSDNTSLEQQSDRITIDKEGYTVGPYTCYGPTYWAGDPDKPRASNEGISFGDFSSSPYYSRSSIWLNNVHEWNPQAGFIFAVKSHTYCYNRLEVEDFVEECRVQDPSCKFVPGESEVSEYEIHETWAGGGVVAEFISQPSACSEGQASNCSEPLTVSSGQLENIPLAFRDNISEDSAGGNITIPRVRKVEPRLQLLPHESDRVVGFKYIQGEFDLSDFARATAYGTCRSGWGPFNHESSNRDSDKFKENLKSDDFQKAKGWMMMGGIMRGPGDELNFWERFYKGAQQRLQSAKVSVLNALGITDEASFDAEAFAQDLVYQPDRLSDAKYVDLLVELHAEIPLRIDGRLNDTCQWVTADIASLGTQRDLQELDYNVFEYILNEDFAYSTLHELPQHRHIPVEYSWQQVAGAAPTGYAMRRPWRPRPTHVQMATFYKDVSGKYPNPFAVPYESDEAPAEETNDAGTGTGSSTGNGTGSGDAYTCDFASCGTDGACQATCTSCLTGSFGVGTGAATGLCLAVCAAPQGASACTDAMSLVCEEQATAAACGTNANYQAFVDCFNNGGDPSTCAEQITTPVGGAGTSG